MKTTHFIYGRRPVEELLRTNLEVEQIQGVFLNKNFPISFQKKISQALPNVPITYLSRKELNDILVQSRKGKVLKKNREDGFFSPDQSTRHELNHQGVIIKKYSSDLPQQIKQKPSSLDHWQSYVQKTGGLLVLLDSIQDANNLGSIIRTTEALGAKSLFITGKGVALGDVAHRVSAGASFHLPIFTMANLHQLLLSLKKMDFWICSSVASEDFQNTFSKQATKKTPPLLNHTDISSLPSPEKLALVLGHEGHGVRPLVMAESDFLISILLHGKTSSLNVGVAAGILLDRLLGQKISRTV